MFEVRCLIADKKLGEALRVLEPYALEPPVVKSAEKQQINFTTKPAAKTGKQSTWGVAKGLVQGMVEKKPKGTKFTAKALREACVAAGLTEYSYSNTLAKYIKDKKIKALNHGTYEVL